MCWRGVLPLCIAAKNVSYSALYHCLVFSSLAILSMELQRHPVAVACLLSCLLALGTSHPDPRQREELIRLEASMRVGGHVKLSPEEQQLDAHLSKLMLEEMTREDFLPALHFFKARPLIRSRPLYGLLQRMPKGTSRTVL